MSASMHAERHPLCIVHAGIRSTSGQYASTGMHSCCGCRYSHVQFKCYDNMKHSD